MPTGPLTRARHLRSILEKVRELPAGPRAAVLDAIGAAALEEVEGSASSDWLPFELDLALTHAVAGVLGPEGTHQFFQQQQLASFQGPLFKALVDSATTIFGLDPGSWARWIPRGWGVVFRDCGRWEIERAGEGRLHAALLALPGACLEDEVWLRSIASSLSAFLAVARCEGEVALVRVDREREAALYRMRWTPGPAQRP